jgi:hypothetical protein
MFSQRRHLCVLVLALLVTCFAANSQQNDRDHASPSTSANLKPDSGKNEQGVYTNYFFGMTYRYPKDWTVQPPLQQAAGGPKIYALLFVTLPGEGFQLTALSVTAREVSTPSLTAEQYLAEENLKRDLSQLHPPQLLSWDQRSFLRFDAEQKGKGGSNRAVELVSIQKGYVLEFFFITTKKHRVKEFDRTLQSIRFSEP